MDPHQFWQQVDETPVVTGADGWSTAYPARLPDGRFVHLPIRVLPGDGTAAVASLIINQASFAVEDALSSALAQQLQPLAPDVIVGVPTLGLTLANNVARRLGHVRMVPLGTSRKFWYDDKLSAPLSSITSPGQQKRIYLDPRMLPLLQGRRIAVIDDVISSGTSMVAVLALLSAAGLRPAAIGAAMLQGELWRTRLAEFQDVTVAPLASPRLRLAPTGLWQPEL